MFQISKNVKRVNLVHRGCRNASVRVSKRVILLTQSNFYLIQRQKTSKRRRHTVALAQSSFGDLQISQLALVNFEAKIYSKTLTRSLS